MLSVAELERYSRQIVLPELGIDGQERLRSARVLVVGAGGLGSPAALYLAAAGIGTIGLVDNDTVDASNLHRQVLHTAADVGRDKTESGAESLRRLNPLVQLHMHQERLTRRRAEILFQEYDVILDGSDNYQTRYAINDACAAVGKPWVYGSVERFSGQVSVFGAPKGPCYRCLFPEAPAIGSTASCEEIGVLGAVPGVVGSLQAIETIKCILDIGEPLIGRLLQIDFLSVSMQTIQFTRREDCPACVETAVTTYANQLDGVEDIEPLELATRITGDGGDSLQLLDIREPWEWAVGRIGDPMFVPMGELERRLIALDRAKEMIVYCHHGTRSSVAVEWLRARGYRARNLVGGIDRWSREIDRTVSRY